MLKRSLLLIPLWFFSLAALAQGGKQESDLKAVFVYNFTKYIEWEAGNTNKDFTIGVIGPSMITESLNEIAKTNTIKNKKIIIRAFSKPDDIAGCDLLFISKNTLYSLASILSKTGKGILTVSEEPGFAKRGTALNFVVMSSKLKFEVNLKALDTAGLKAGSQLLKLAIIIDEE
jgi:hypothetical protein